MYKRVAARHRAVVDTIDLSMFRSAVAARTEAAR
jgi:hypothetical protein